MLLPDDPWSYITGLFEGRGWVTTQRHRNRPQEYVNLVLAMRDPGPLLAIHDAIGWGRVNGPYDRQGGGIVERGDYHQRYVLTISRRAHVDAFLERVYRHLSSEKQEQVLIAMAKDTRSPKWVEPT